jgi:hypothetical protein
MADETRAIQIIARQPVHIQPLIIHLMMRTDLSQSQKVDEIQRVIKNSNGIVINDDFRFGSDSSFDLLYADIII